MLPFARSLIFIRLKHWVFFDFSAGYQTSEARASCFGRYAALSNLKTSGLNSSEVDGYIVLSLPEY